MVGLIYLSSVGVVGALLFLTSRRRHESQAEADVFRFPTVLIRALQVGTFAPILVGIGIYNSFPYRPGIVEITTVSIVFGSMTLIVLASAILTARFRLALFSQYMIIYDDFKKRTVNFIDVRRIVIARPWRGRGRLELFGEDGKRMCKIDGGVQDFDDLADTVESRCPSHIYVREQDTNGKWTTQDCTSNTLTARKT
jgi:hypothetical protein